MMNLLKQDDTIAAISTPPGSGGIGIVKISGPQARDIARGLFRRRGRRSGPGAADADTAASAPSHRLRYGDILDPENDAVVDEVLMSEMSAPNTYTGETVVEINAHGGPVVLRSILNLVLRQGARLAEPGEFTFRAFINGRIDLTQAEAVVDVINAKTGLALTSASEMLTGQMGDTIRGLRDLLADYQARLAAAIDFPEDVADVILGENDIEHLMRCVRQPLERMVARYEEGHILREGLRLAVIGKTNVGKSSLMNRLLQKDRVIVTETPGTTRDAVEDMLNIRGIPVILVDTAGLRHTHDPVEAVGIERTRTIIRQADMILFMVDAACGVTAEDREIFQTIGDKTVLTLVNKIDRLVEGAPLPDVGDVSRNRPVPISVTQDIGIDALEARIAEAVFEGAGEFRPGAAMPNQRQKEAMLRCMISLDGLIAAIQRHELPELMAVDLTDAITYLNDIIGVHTAPDVLDRVFSRFCIGK